MPGGWCCRNPELSGKSFLCTFLLLFPREADSLVLSWCFIFSISTVYRLCTANIHASNSSILRKYMILLKSRRETIMLIFSEESSWAVENALRIFRMFVKTALGLIHNWRALFSHSQIVSHFLTHCHRLWAFEHQQSDEHSWVSAFVGFPKEGIQIY